MGPLTLTPSLLHSVLVVGTADELIWRVCFSPDGKLLATAGKEGVIRVSSRTFILAIVIAVITIFETNAQHSATFGALDDIAKERIRDRFEGHTWGICSLTFSSDGRFLVSGSADRTTRIWNMADGSSKTLPITGNVGARVESVAISSDGQLIAAGSSDTVRDL